MSIKPSTGLLLVVVILINLVSSAYIAQNLASQIVEQDNSDEEITALSERVDELSRRLEILTDHFESKLGLIRELHPIDTSKDIESFEDGLVTIGVIPATSQGYEDYITYVDEIIEPDLNALAWDMGSDLRFEFDVRDAQGQAAIHLESVQYLNSKGVNLVIGGMWSSQACASLSYCNDNGLILFSPSSTSPLPARAPSSRRTIEFFRGLNYSHASQGLSNAIQPYMVRL